MLDVRLRIIVGCNNIVTRNNDLAGKDRASVRNALLCESIVTRAPCFLTFSRSIVFFPERGKEREREPRCIYRSVAPFFQTFTPFHTLKLEPSAYVFQHFLIVRFFPLFVIPFGENKLPTNRKNSAQCFSFVENKNWIESCFFRGKSSIRNLRVRNFLSVCDAKLLIQSQLVTR